MAVVAINDKLPTRLMAGGSLVIDDGTTEHDIYALDGSSVKVMPGGYESLRRHDKGEMAATLEGDERHTRLTFRVKCTAPGTNNLRTLATARNTSGASAGLKKVYTVYWKVLDAKGLATGTKESIANCYFEKPPDFAGGGADFDYWEFEMESTEPDTTRSTF